MRLTVLGSSASYAGPGRACAGYLVRSGETSLLLDFGNGVLANLSRFIDPLTLDGVLLTHGHPDHFLDLYAMQALLRYAPQGPAPAMPLWAPEGLFERLRCLHQGKGAEEMAQAFESHVLRHGEPVEFEDVRVTPREVDHVPGTFALVVEDAGGRLCYTSDTRYGDAAIEAARGADLLLADATLPEAYAGKAPHMTASECGRLAKEAEASRLVLTHIWPTNDRAEMTGQAEAAFHGPVQVAEESVVYDIG